MTRLFYSTPEDILFWIAGYDNAQSGNVEEFISELQYCSNLLADISGKKFSDIASAKILDSRKFTGMRTYWVVNPVHIPTEALHIISGMDAWIRN